MKYKKYDGIAYNLHIIKTDKFKQMTVRIDFRNNLNKPDITNRSLLSKVLLESNKNYQSKRLLAIEAENLYNTNIHINNTLSGNVIITSFRTTFLNEKYTEEKMNEKSIKFLFDILFNPNINDGKFETNGFKLAKNTLIKEIKSVSEQPNSYSLIMALEQIEADKPISYRSVGYIEDLENIDEQTLYEYYLNMLKTNVVDIYVIGDVNFDDINKYFKKEFTINTLKRSKPKHYINHNFFKGRFKTVKEKMKTNQSNLVMIYKINSLTPFEIKYVMPVYNYILGGGADSRLFKTVREENSLCYTIYSTFNHLCNLLIIRAGIDAKDFKKVVTLIKKAVKDLNKGLFDDSDLEKAKNTFLSSYQEILDSEKAILNVYAAKEYLGSDLIEEREKEIIKVTKEMVLNITSKIHPELIFLLEGYDK